jgi:hypothetical protein
VEEDILVQLVQQNFILQVEVVDLLVQDHKSQMGQQAVLVEMVQQTILQEVV